MTTLPPALIDDSRAVLARHARSFRWAGALLPRASLDDAAVLYAFCRLVDDLADEAPDADRARADLAEVRAELLDERPARPLIVATRALLDRGPTGIAPAPSQKRSAGCLYHLDHSILSMKLPPAGSAVRPILLVGRFLAICR